MDLQISIPTCALKADLKDGFAGPDEQRHRRLCAGPLPAVQQ